MHCACIARPDADWSRIVKRSWVNKNPWLSMWLSSANAIVDSTLAARLRK